MQTRARSGGKFSAALGLAAGGDIDFNWHIPERLRYAHFERVGCGLAIVHEVLHGERLDGDFVQAALKTPTVDAPKSHAHSVIVRGGIQITSQRRCKIVASEVAQKKSGGRGG